MQSSLRFPSPTMGDNNSLSLGGHGYTSPCLILKNEVAGSLPPSTLKWLRHRERSYPPQSFQKSLLGACGGGGASAPSQQQSRGSSNAWIHTVRRRTGAGANKERMLQQIKNRLYQQLHPIGYSDVALEHGYSAIFNLEFSPSG